jgi:hypothetical protein
MATSPESATLRHVVGKAVKDTEYQRRDTFSDRFCRSLILPFSISRECQVCSSSLSTITLPSTGPGEKIRQRRPQDPPGDTPRTPGPCLSMPNPNPLMRAWRKPVKYVQPKKSTHSKVPKGATSKPPYIFPSRKSELLTRNSPRDMHEQPSQNLDQHSQHPHDELEADDEARDGTPRDGR